MAEVWYWVQHSSVIVPGRSLRWGLSDGYNPSDSSKMGMMLDDEGRWWIWRPDREPRRWAQLVEPSNGDHGEESPRGGRTQ